MSEVSLLLIGCGRMGGALLDGWLAQSALSFEIGVVDPTHVAPHKTQKHIVHHFPELQRLPKEWQPDVVVLGVKPQMLSEVLPDVAAQYGLHPLYLSIAAGRRLEDYLSVLGSEARMVRAMPNSPASIGMGVTVLCATTNVTEEERGLAGKLMEAVGITQWLEDEGLMDAVTALSGSGPAYVFYFMECMIRAALDLGLDEEVARTLVLHTVHGSSALAFGGDEPLDMLRRNVTSPGGTTEAALEVLMNPSGMCPLLEEAIQAAVVRAQQLSQAS